MKISLFTPTHDAKFLLELYDSIKDQNFYEWVIVYNNGAVPVYFDDHRVKSHVLPFAPQWVGPLKAFACSLCTGDILVEMDHDDLLTHDAIAEISKAFEDPEIGFVYSNTIHCTGKFEKTQRYNSDYGWAYREANFKGHFLDEHISFAPDPNSIGRIWFAPNHVRAFRTSVYNHVGGYNTEMRVLDDLDLMMKLYKVTKFKHIDKGLYVYRVHGENTWLKYNTEIQNNVYNVYDKHIQDLCLRWAKLNKLRSIDIGGAIDPAQGFEIVDRHSGDVVCDLNDRWPFEDGSVGVVRAHDVLEHLRDPLHSMKEIYRVLAPGGYALIQVPSTDGRGAFQDPTHRCLMPQTKILCSDFYWREAKDLSIGDKLLAFGENEPIDDPGRGNGLRRLRTATIEANEAIVMPCLKIKTNIGPEISVSIDHQFLLRKTVLKGRNKGLYPVWEKAKNIKIGDEIIYFGTPWSVDNSRNTGWLAGIFDGEGCLVVKSSGRAGLSVCQRESNTLDRIKTRLKNLDFKFRESLKKAVLGNKPCYSIDLLGGYKEIIRFLGIVCPERFMDRDLTVLYDGARIRNDTFGIAKVESIEYIGVQKVMSVQTSTKTLIAEGYFSHNSFWNENSFLYYTNSKWSRYIGTPIRFQEMRRYTTAMNSDRVCWTIAHLVKLNENTGRRFPGLINI